MKIVYDKAHKRCWIGEETDHINLFDVDLDQSPNFENYYDLMSGENVLLVIEKNKIEIR